jgi:hypothetical protein
MGGAIRTDGKRVVAYRANQDFEQSLGEHRAHHLMSLDGSWANAFLLILWSGGISYVRPFCGGMAASGSVSWSTPLAKML